VAEVGDRGVWDGNDEEWGSCGRQWERLYLIKIQDIYKNVVKSIFIRTFVSSKVPLSDKEKWGF
jgi:hypothetical protein